MMIMISVLLLVLAVIGYISVPLLGKKTPDTPTWDQRTRLEKTLEQEIQTIRKSR